MKAWIVEEQDNDGRTTKASEVVIVETGQDRITIIFPARFEDNDIVRDSDQDLLMDHYKTHFTKTGFVINGYKLEERGKETVGIFSAFEFLSEKPKTRRKK